MNQTQYYILGPLAQKKFPRHIPFNISAYKFLHKDDLRYWVSDKTIKIDSLLSFSSQDNIGGVGDPQEVEVSGISCNLDRVEGSSLELDNLRQLGININTRGSVQVINGTYRRPNRYIYCMSSIVNEQLFKKWHEVEGYDAIIKIKDVASFLQAIQLADFHGRQLLGGGGVVDWVEYVDMPLDLSCVDLTRQGFLKNKGAFEWQKELRFAWPRVLEENNSPYFLHIPSLSDYFEVMDVPDCWKT